MIRRRTILPQRFHFSHRYAFDLHDTIANYLSHAETNGLLNYEFVPRDPEAFARDVPSQGEELIDWLEANGYDNVIGEMVYRQVLGAVTSDACHFLFEALTCSERGKLTVAYALLRKPLRDDLLILELLLADPRAFLNTFWTCDPSQLAIQQLSQRQNALPIIEKAIERGLGARAFDATFLYEVRFEKTQHFSLDGLWHKALHLVTTNKHIATERQNLNFVFSDEEAHTDQWTHFYDVVPLILLHMVNVCTSLMRHLWDDSPPVNIAAEHLHRGVGLVLSRHEASAFRDANRGPTASPAESLPLYCRRCERDFEPSIQALHFLYTRRSISCLHCRKRLRLRDLLLNDA